MSPNAKLAAAFLFGLLLAASCTIYLTTPTQGMTQADRDCEGKGKPVLIDGVFMDCTGNKTNYRGGIY